MKPRKKITAILLALVLALSMAACGSGTGSKDASNDETTTTPRAADALKGIFDTFVKSQSYTDIKSSYDNTTFEETQDENGITVKVRGTGGIQGTYSFPARGGYLSCEAPDEQYFAPVLFNLIVNSIGEYYGIDATLFSGYINGLKENEIKSKTYAVVKRSDGSSALKVKYQEKPEMNELDEMYINETTLKDLSKDTTNAIKSIGRMFLNISINSSDNTIQFAIGEYGNKNTELTYKSMLEIVNHFKPNGYADFIKNYTEPKTAEAETYTVTDDVKKYSEGSFQPVDGYSFLYVTFGSKNAEKK